jgi:PPK2 family polyphosphate:nucleotide phosphotransferase
VYSVLIDLKPAARNGRTMVTFQKASTGYSYKVLPGYRIRLADYDCSAPPGITEDDAKDLLKDLLQEFSDQQTDMFGAAAAQLATAVPATTPARTPFVNPQPRTSHALMAVIQGTDGSGKDGLIRTVFGALNPLWLRCDGFKAATFDEVGRDFMWRSHRIAPKPGFTSALHRSYYEGVLSERVHGEVPPDVWSARYDQINSFESVLGQANTVICKFMLHVSKDEQKQRLLAREDQLSTAWKLSAVDWQERRLWDDYEAAFEDMLSKTSTDNAPWWIVPADDKWFAQLALADALVSTLRPLRAGWQAVLADMQATNLKEIDKVGRV